MDDFDEIYSNIDQSNVGVTNKTGTGKFVLQTSPEFSGTITGTYTLSGTPTLSGTFAGTPTFSGDITFGSKAKFDANNYVYLSAANTVSVYTNASLAAQFDSNNIALGAGRSLSVQTGQKVYLDGGVNDFWTNSANGINELWSNAIKTLSTDATGSVTFEGNVALKPNQTLYLDSMLGNDYWVNSANGQNDLYANGVLAIRTTGTGHVNLPNGISLAEGQILYLDATGDDYWTNSADGQNDLYSNGVLAIRTNGTGEVLLANVDPPTANYANRNGIVKAWANITFTVSGGITSGAVINQSYNVISAGAGIGAPNQRFRVVWNTDFSSTTYAYLITDHSGGVSTTQISIDATSVTIGGTAVDGSYTLSFIAIGTQ